MKSAPAVLINGEPGDLLPVRDRGLQYGDGVFETVAISRGKPLLWRRHLQRLQKGCARLGITPPDETQMRQEVDRLCTAATRAVLKIVVTRGESGRGYAPTENGNPTRVLALSPWPDYRQANAHEGVDVRICETRISRNPRLAGIKHLNRLEQVLARSEWHAEFAEGLMLDEGNNVIEGTTSNLFLVSEGTLLTPDLSKSGVEGVMRQTVLDHGKALSLPCRISRVTLDMLDGADEIFLTNSLIGIWPVRRIASRSYTLGETTRCLQKRIKGSHCFGDTD